MLGHHRGDRLQVLKRTGRGLGLGEGDCVIGTGGEHVCQLGRIVYAAPVRVPLLDVDPAGASYLCEPVGEGSVDEAQHPPPEGGIAY